MGALRIQEGVFSHPRSVCATRVCSRAYKCLAPVALSCDDDGHDQQRNGKCTNQGVDDT